MPSYRSYLAKRWRLATKGVGGICGWVSLFAGAAMALLVWIAPDWARQHISDRMNAFVLGLIPLMSGGSVFMVRWVMSSFWLQSDIENREAQRDQTEGKKKRVEAISLELSKLMTTGNDLLRKTRSGQSDSAIETQANEWFRASQEFIFRNVGETALHLFLDTTGVEVQGFALPGKYFWNAEVLYNSIYPRVCRLKELIDKLQSGAITPLS